MMISESIVVRLLCVCVCVCEGMCVGGMHLCRHVVPMILIQQRHNSVC